MANAQSVSSRRVESVTRSHESVMLRSGRRIQYESPVARRQVTLSLEHILVDHRLGAGTATAPSSPSFSLLLTWLFFVTLINRCRQTFVCLIFVGRGAHENLSPTKISPFMEEHFIYRIQYKTLIYRTVLSTLTVLCFAIPRVYTGRGVDFHSLHRQRSHTLKLIYALQKL